MRSALATLYGAAVRARAAAYARGWFRTQRVGVPVVSVGNITAGGAGKTPMVVALVAKLLARGAHPAVVSRGYGRRTRGTVVVSDGAGAVVRASEGGDEPVLIARRHPRVPVVADARRVRGARQAVGRFGADVLVLDDAFQHRACARDLDVVLVEAGTDPASDALLPAGRLRERPAALGRAHLVVASRAENRASCADAAERLAAFTGAPIACAAFRPRAFRDVWDDAEHPRDALRGRRVLSFCGIASPVSFLATLDRLGVVRAAHRTFRDHAPFRDRDCDALCRVARAAGVDTLVTTEKDAVRLLARREAFAGFAVFYPVMHVVWLSGEDTVDALLDALVASRSS